MNLKQAIRSIMGQELLLNVVGTFSGQTIRAIAKLENQFVVLTNTDHNLVNADGSIVKQISYAEYLGRV